MSEKTNILLCVAGATPQIITETLYDLTIQKGKKIDEIRVITTLDGRDKIMTGIIKGRGSAEESLLHPEKGQFFAFLSDYPQVGKIEFDETKISLLHTRDGITLDDIRTPEENELAGDQICEIVREICKDENIKLFASAAGGRKTMSIYLTAAMQLFGRADDSLSHVLVNEDFEGGLAPHFFYPPPTPRTLTLRDGRKVSTKNAKIYLAEVPFIRLRGIGVEAFDDKAKTYKQAVDKAQSDLKLAESAYELRFDLKRNRLKLADRIVKLSLREFFVYAMLAYFRKNGTSENGFVALNKINREHLDVICRLISKPRGKERRFEDFEFLPRADFIYSFDVESVRDKSEEDGDRISVAEAREEIVQTFREIFSKTATNKLKPARFPEEFEIESRNKNGVMIYGLKIAPERIIFE